jgi:hypothetical protein
MRYPSIVLAAPLVLGALATRGAEAQCAVSGPDSLCAGGAVELCAPEGPFVWLWSAPDGSDLPSTRCVTANQPGTYLLTVFDTVNGLSFTCTHTLHASNCAPPPPPPPPPPPASGPDCPRPAWWWRQQCAPQGRSEAALSSTALGALTACATDLAGRAGSDAAAVCAALERPHGRDARWRAERQLTALRLNLCARQHAVRDARGTVVGVAGTSTVRGLGGVADGTSIGVWLDAATAEMASLAGRSLREKPVRRAYERIRRTAFAINHGQGLASACDMGTVAGRGSEDDALEYALEEGSGRLEVERLTPNPTAGATRVAWSLAEAGEVELTVVDIAGRTVRTLVRGWRPAGAHEQLWDGTAEDGRPLRSGAYFVHGSVGGERVRARLVLVR